MSQFPIGIVGIVALLAIAFLLSSNKRAISLRVVVPAFLMQAGIAVLVLRTDVGVSAIGTLSNGVSALLGYADEGKRFLFGDLATMTNIGFALAALPVIIFFAALVSVLYHLHIMQFIVRWVGGAIEKVTGVSKVESLCAAANIFVGQSESPLVIRPYLAALSPSQMFAVMCVGMAGVAGTILAVYASLLGPESLPHLLAASFMAAPGGLLMAKIMMPDVRHQPVEGELPLEADGDPLSEEERVIRAIEAAEEEEKSANIIMAASMGAQTGVRIAVAVGAMVFAFVGLVALANGILGGIGGWFGYSGLSFQSILGTVFAPFMYLIGIPWNETGAAGSLFGTKIVLNEVVAFLTMRDVTGLSPHSVAIMTFALCGFANFSSIAIQMASAGSLAPNQRPTIAKLGIRALIAGSLANLMSAALAGLLLA